MLSATAKNDLALLRKGKLDMSVPSAFDQLSGKSLIDELVLIYPFVFQRRDDGRKREIGMAREVAYELVFQKLRDSLFHGVRLHPTLLQCYFISTYDDSISEITWASKLQVRPFRGSGKGLALSFRSGFKLDKTMDGWTVKPLVRRKTVLSEDFLRKRGWRFDVLPPFGARAVV
ncbi:MAG TPA: hypothetical protein VMV69_26225 [Pirellulales bacterium]|nr:hypothetical protein [Pirellulales bacterium]